MPIKAENLLITRKTMYLPVTLGGRHNYLQGAYDGLKNAFFSFDGMECIETLGAATLNINAFLYKRRY